MSNELPDKSYISVPNRYLCSVLEEMRECVKHLNFSYLPSLIEEAQMMANRMEASLEDSKDRKALLEDIRKLKVCRDELYKECEELIIKRTEEKNK